MKLLIASPDFPCWDGGVAVWAEKLAGHGARQGADITAFTPRQLPQDSEFDAAQSYRVMRVRNVKDRYLKYVYSQWRLGRLLARERFDAVLSTTWYPYANPAIRAAGSTPVFIMAHGNDFLEARWQRPVWRKRMDGAFHQARGVIAVSQETARALCRTIPGLEARTTVIFPAVDPEAFPPAELPLKPVLLSLGRLVERKGQDKVLQALPRILREFPAVQYWIAGKGAHRAALENLARERGVAEHVRFLGFVPEERRLELYQQCSVYVMPSRSSDARGDFEGFGITFLEANACGKPVIGGRGGGVGEAVLDGVTGLLVDPECEADVAEKILRLLRDPVYARRLGAEGRARVERELNWETTTKRVLNWMAAASSDGRRPN